MAIKDSTLNLGGIYVLKCPITLEVKYIGQTVNFELRKRAHFHTNGESLRLKFWFEKLNKINLKPIFEAYLICDSQEVKDKVEKALINKMQKSLLNAKAGGRGKAIFIKKFKKRTDFL